MILVDFEKLLANCLKFADDNPLFAPVKYSLLSGGKRIRARLVYAMANEYDVAEQKINSAALAVESLHAYSLIHDDLPAMDNDDYRRGKASCHCAFGEDLAILAGDYLNSFAFELLSDNFYLTDLIKIKQIKILSRAGRLMVCGQSIDMSATGKKLTLPELESLHWQKTGALINACFHLSAIASEKHDYDEQLIQIIGEILGVVYQIQDDLLDVTKTSQQLGKTSGKDQKLGKNSYLNFYSIDQLTDLLIEKQQLLQQKIQYLPQKGRCLQAILQAIFDRNS